MIRQTFLPMTTFVMIAMCSVGCTAPKNTVNASAAPQARWGQFFAGLEARNHLPSSWDEVAADARAAGIGDDVSLDDWARLLHLAKKSGMTSRRTLLLHPVTNKREYFDVVVEILGCDADLFLREQVFDLMVRQHPDDPRTPRYGLHLLLDLWNHRPLEKETQWTPAIELDYRLKEAVIILLNGQWEFPFEMKPGGEWVTPEICTSLLLQQSDWRFDKSDNKWHVQSAPPR